MKFNDIKVLHSPQRYFYILSFATYALDLGFKVICKKLCRSCMRLTICFFVDVD